MKRTTYIIIGIIVFAWIAIPITFLILPKKNPVKDILQQLFPNTISFHKTTEEIPSKVCALKVAIIQPDSFSIHLSGIIEIGNDKSGSCTLTSSSYSSFISRRIDNDTLIVTFDFSRNPPSTSPREGHVSYNLGGTLLHLNINTNLLYVANSVDGMSITMQKLEQDSISVQTTSEVRINSCRFHSFVLKKDTHYSLPHLQLFNSEIVNLQADPEVQIGIRNSKIAHHAPMIEEEQ
ncbi:hypothetical protein EZS27_034397 [termite gut metagenome]|uniref:Uncharacterized protein n=1 Tax=termite gut metagenome TaxID=433724 RepID=A0A5J4Q005_9ZZZZ